ncbi:hypothetical protein [Bacillus phage SWEP1]|nr:hypothetical protein [Bacillus phage SWEP1]
MTGTIELNTYENKTITFNKARLTDFVINSWGFSSLNDFLSDYTYDDTFYLGQNDFLLNNEKNTTTELTSKNAESKIHFDVYEDGEAFIGVHCKETNRGFTINTDEETMLKLANNILSKVNIINKK